MKRLLEDSRRGQRGFTMIELLIVVAILGMVAAVAIPNVGKFVGRGKTESYRAELHNIQTAVMGMLVDSSTGVMVAVQQPTNDMDDVVTTDNPPKVLSDYVTGLNADGSTRTGATYTFTADGKVVQTVP